MSSPVGETPTSPENDPNLPQVTPLAVAIPRYDNRGKLDAEPEWRMGFTITEGSVTADQVHGILERYGYQPNPNDSTYNPMVIVTLTDGNSYGILAGAAPYSQNARHGYGSLVHHQLGQNDPRVGMEDIAYYRSHGKESYAITCGEPLTVDYKSEGGSRNGVPIVRPAPKVDGLYPAGRVSRGGAMGKPASEFERFDDAEAYSLMTSHAPIARITVVAPTESPYTDYNLQLAMHHGGVDAALFTVHGEQFVPPATALQLIEYGKLRNPIENNEGWQPPLSEAEAARIYREREIAGFGLNLLMAMVAETDSFGGMEQLTTLLDRYTAWATLKVNSAVYDPASDMYRYGQPKLPEGSRIPGSLETIVTFLLDHPEVEYPDSKTRIRLLDSPREREVRIGDNEFVVIGSFDTSAPEFRITTATGAHNTFAWLRAWSSSRHGVASPQLSISRPSLFVLDTDMHSVGIDVGPKISADSVLVFGSFTGSITASNYLLVTGNAQAAINAPVTVVRQGTLGRPDDAYRDRLGATITLRRDMHGQQPMHLLTLESGFIEGDVAANKFVINSTGSTVRTKLPAGYYAHTPRDIMGKIDATVRCDQLVIEPGSQLPEMGEDGHIVCRELTLPDTYTAKQRDAIIQQLHITIDPSLAL